MAGLMEMFGDFDKNDDGVVQVHTNASSGPALQH
jgi:hypothetical protein